MIKPETLKGVAAMDQAIASCRDGLTSRLQTVEQCEVLNTAVGTEIQDACESGNSVRAQLGLLLQIGWLTYAQSRALIEV